MNRLTRFYKARLPGAVTLGLVWMQTSLFPARHYRRVAAVMRKLNRPKAVLGGPFVGMRYTQAPDKAFLARLFGTYELETYPAIERLITFDPDVVAVAGAGEGYFAVGMALRLPRARVHAFEIWKWARYLLGRTIRTNGVGDRVEMHGLCTPPELSRVLEGARRAAVICDIEGGESEVLDPVKAPGLRSAAMLVELHPMIVDGIDGLLRERFAATHDIATMTLGPRTVSDAPALVQERISADDIVWATDEIKVRGVGQDWMLLMPRGRALNAS